MPHSAPSRPAATRGAHGAPGRPARPGSPMTRVWAGLEGARALDLSAFLIGTSAALLTVLGLVMVLSSSSVEAIGTGGGSYDLFLRQLMWAGVGVAVLIGFSLTPLRVLKALAWPAIGMAILLLVLVAFTPLGVEVGGNRNWLGIGGFRMQPSEAAKLALALWSGAVLERKARLISHVKHALLPVLPMAALLIGLVLAGRDLGTALILALVLMTVLFVAGTHRGVFLVSGAVVTVGAILMTVFAPHRMVRVQAWRGICDFPTDPCFQPDHGMFALASGGWWGVGLGQSRQKWSYIPEAENDFIFTILGEELGLVGTLAVILAFAALAVGMYRVAARTTSTFIRLTTWGILAWLVGQAFVNIAMVSGMIPVVGVPLPFISYGGSALTLSLAAVGVVLSFARHERQRAAELRALAHDDDGAAGLDDGPAADAVPDARPASRAHTDSAEPETDPIPLVPSPTRAPQES